MIKVGSDFSGVGAFNQALIKLGKPFKEVFACDMDKYARQTFIENYGEPEYFPTNVYDREIPTQSLDIYMTSPPCQAFSLAGKRLGKEDKRGILFFNSHEFIQVNKPRFFIFENVKGLLSDNGGKTFSEWVAMLGGKSVNGNPILFPYEDSVPYHLYWKVLNAKEHGIPQNRERVFLIGIRDDNDNKFQFPKEEYLTKRLKDVLQNSIDKKYFLSEKMIELMTFETKGNYEVANTNKGGQKGIIQSENGEAISCLSATDYKQPKQILTNSVTETIIKVGNTNPSGNGMNGNVYHENGISPTLWSGHGEGIKVKSATLKGYEQATEGDSINFTFSNSKTQRGRVAKEVAQTLEGICNQGVLSYTRDNKGKVVSRHVNQESNTIHASTGGGGNTDQFVIYNDKRLNETISKNTLIEREIKILDTYNKTIHNECPTLKEPHHNDRRLWDGYKIRRLTPRECFRLMDFPDSFNWTCSDSQAYKQAGNSIVVNVIYKILKQLPL